MKKQKNYYDESYYHPLILEYQSLPSESPRAKEIAGLLYVGIVQIAKAIIFYHRFFKYEKDLDELVSEAVIACYKSLKTFDPNFITSKGVKVTSFNFLSLVCKRALTYYSIREQKHRNNSSLIQYHETTPRDDQPNYGDHYYFEQGTEDTIISSTFSKDLFTKMRSLLKSKVEIKMLPVVIALESFINDKGYYNKRHFCKYCVSNNIKIQLVRKFWLFVKAHKSEIENVDIQIN